MGTPFYETQHVSQKSGFRDTRHRHGGLERDALGAHSYTDLTQIDVDWISEYLDEMMEPPSGIMRPKRFISMLCEVAFRLWG